MKKLLLLFAALCCMLSASAYDFVVDGIYYNINGNELTVTKDKSVYSSYRGDVVIPDTVVHDGVTYTVTAIESLAFRHCYQMPTVTLPNTLKTICDSAFYICSGLESFYVPKSVSYIGHAILGGADGLKSLVVDPENPYYDSRDSCNAIIETSTDRLIQGSGPTVVPNTVKIIGQQAFDYCRAMKNIVLPSSVKTIELRAFFLADFDSFTFSDSLERIEKYAFLTCNGMWNQSIVLPNTLTYVAPFSFANCNLKGISMAYNASCPYYTLANSLIEKATRTIVVGTSNSYITADMLIERIGEAAFMGCVTRHDLCFGRYVTEVGDYAFYNNYSIFELNIPERITKIGNYAFAKCGGYSLTIPKGIKSIGRGVFNSCAKLRTVVIGDSVESIGDYAFMDCTNLQDVKIGSGVQEIGNQAFANCNALTTVTCQATIPPVIANENCFTATAYENATLHVPSASLSAYNSADCWSLFYTSFGNSPGDVNGDGNFSVSDVTELVDALMSGGETTPMADVNGDGIVSIIDVTVLIDMMLNLN